MSHVFQSTNCYRLYFFQTQQINLQERIKDLACYHYFLSSKMTIRSSLLLGALLFSALQSATAIPHRSNNLARALVKRSDVTFEDCGDENDPRRQKAGQAWSEAANLADNAIGGTLDSGTAFKDTDAYVQTFAYHPKNIFNSNAKLASVSSTTSRAPMVTRLPRCTAASRPARAATLATASS